MTDTAVATKTTTTVTRVAPGKSTKRKSGTKPKRKSAKRATASARPAPVKLAELPKMEARKKMEAFRVSTREHNELVARCLKEKHPDMSTFYRIQLGLAP